MFSVPTSWKKRNKLLRGERRGEPDLRSPKHHTVQIYNSHHTQVFFAGDLRRSQGSARWFCTRRSLSPRATPVGRPHACRAKAAAAADDDDDDDRDDNVKGRVGGRCARSATATAGGLARWRRARQASGVCALLGSSGLVQVPSVLTIINHRHRPRWFWVRCVIVVASLGHRWILQRERAQQRGTMFVSRRLRVLRA